MPHNFLQQLHYLHLVTYIVFCLVQSTEDWIEDFKQFLSDSPNTTVLEDMYPDAYVHHGFLQQLQAVTDKAPNRTQNIGDVINDMSGGVPPSLVIVTGMISHSCQELPQSEE